MGRLEIKMSVALFGGTFDPVHNGHLRIASELAELLSVNELRLMPCRLPPHRDEPKVSADQRRKMLELGIGANNSVLSVEDIELHRPAPSYSIDTVALIREQLGSLTPLFLCVGMDALATINTWRDWEKLLSFCHIAVSSRPGFSAPKKGPLYEWIAQHECDNLNEIKQCPSGYIYFCDLTMLAISSTTIRDKIKQGSSIRYMAPEPVVNYIQQHRLYE